MFHSTGTKGLQVVTDAMKMYPYLGSNIRRLSKLQRIMAEKMQMVKVVNLDRIREDGRKYLPKRIRLMMGNSVLKAGDKVTEEK